MVLMVEAAMTSKKKSNLNDVKKTASEPVPTPGKQPRYTTEKKKKKKVPAERPSTIARRQTAARLAPREIAP
jgi:hypothetical protein